MIYKTYVYNGIIQPILISRHSTEINNIGQYYEQIINKMKLCTRKMWKKKKSHIIVEN